MMRQLNDAEIGILTGLPHGTRVEMFCRFRKTTIVRRLREVTFDRIPTLVFDDGQPQSLCMWGELTEIPGGYFFDDYNTMTVKFETEGVI